MRSVAPGDEHRLYPFRRSVTHEGDVGRFRVSIVDLDVFDPVDDQTAPGIGRGEEVLLHLGLPVDGDVFVGRLLEVDPQHPLSEGDGDAAVDEALAQHPLAEPGVAQHPGGAELEDPGPYPLHDVLPRLALEDDALDAPEVEQMGEQQTRRSAADDHHLCVDSRILPELRRRKAEDGRRKSECWRLHAVRVAALSGRVMLGSTSDGGPRCLEKPRTVGPRWSELRDRKGRRRSSAEMPPEPEGCVGCSVEQGAAKHGRQT